MYDTQVWGTPAAWAVAVGTIIGLLGVAVQVNRARRVTYGEFVHELDKDYRRYIVEFSNEGENEVEGGDSAVKILERVLFFEKVKVLLDQKVIKMSTIDVMFAGRFFALAHSEKTHILLKHHENHVTAFFALHAQWVTHRRKRGEPIPLDHHNLAKSRLFGENQYETLVRRGEKLSK